MKLYQIKNTRTAGKLSKSLLDVPQLTQWAGKHYADNFYCYDKSLTSLEGAPSSVLFVFSCHSNKLRSLDGAPASVGGSFYCHNNRLTSLEGAPASIGRSFFCSNNRLTSLKDVHLHIKQMNGVFDASDNPIKSHVLGILLIKGITKIQLDNKQVADILSSHLPSKGMHSVLEAQAELQAAGLDDFAQL